MFRVFSLCSCLVVSTSATAIDCLEKLIAEMTDFVSFIHTQYAVERRTRRKLRNELKFRDETSKCSLKVNALAK